MYFQTKWVTIYQNCNCPIQYNTSIVLIKKIFDVQTININRQKITKYLSVIFNFITNA